MEQVERERHDPSLDGAPRKSHRECGGDDPRAGQRASRGAFPAGSRFGGGALRRSASWLVEQGLLLRVKTPYGGSSVSLVRSTRRSAAVARSARSRRFCLAVERLAGVPCGAWPLDSGHGSLCKLRSLCGVRVLVPASPSETGSRGSAGRFWPCLSGGPLAWKYAAYF